VFRSGSRAAEADADPTGTSGPRRADGPLRYLLVGGGATPESTEVSLEQDIDRMRRTLPPPGEILFAGGTGSRSVRELDPGVARDNLLTELGELFHPRSGRTSKYRPPRFTAGRSSQENLEERLGFALDEATAVPLLLYIATHGDQGETPRGNSVALWAGRTLTVERLASLLDGHARPVRMVITSCFSGGFAELAFAHADEHAGPSRETRCGLFAGTWDRETSGCDANPDRRAQESYGLHFVHALAGTDRGGATIDVDFDRDGKVGLLDAHTRATIAAVSLDVPTTTSERWLRSVERVAAPIDAATRKAMPEAAAVVAELGAALSLPDEASVERRWTDLDRDLDDLDGRVERAENTLGASDAALGARLLERWPVLDDPFHPAFAGTLSEGRDAIREVLEESAEAKARDEAQDELESLDADLSRLEVEEARVLRLKRAYETLHKAAALRRHGGKNAARYEALLACERGTP
jgi:hypothetical protein